MSNPPSPSLRVTTIIIGGTSHVKSCNVMGRHKPACQASLLLVSVSLCVIIARQAPHLIVQRYVPPTLRVQTVAYKYNSSGKGCLRVTTINSHISINCLHRFDTKPAMLFPVLALVLRRAVLDQLALATNLSTYRRASSVCAPFATRGRALATLPNSRVL